MKRITSLAWLLAAAVCLSSCGGGTTSQYQAAPAGAPFGLNYPDPNTFVQGVTITPLVPMVSGNPTSYFVIPDLPAGLILHSDGVISGTPAGSAAPETYVVTAGNAVGTSSFGVRITVAGRYTVGGSVSGLTGTGLVLTNNGVENLAVNANGAFTFPTLLPTASPFNVTVATQPAGETCTVANGSGTLTNSNYNSAAVTCTGNIAIGNAVGIQYIACFYPPSPESIRGYVVNPVTEVVTTLGELIFQSDTAPETVLPAGCAPRLVTMDPSGMRVYVVDEETNAVSVYSTALWN